MAHTDEEIEAAEAKLAARLESGSTFNMQPIPELRAVADAAVAVQTAEALLRERVRIARARGNSWNRIAIPLGVSRQAARQRFGDDARDQDSAATEVLPGVARHA